MTISKMDGTAVCQFRRMPMVFAGEISWFDQYGKVCCSTIDAGHGWEIKERQLSCRELGIQLSYRISSDGTLSLPLDELYESGKTRVRELVLWPELISGYEGEEKSLILPQGSGALVHLRNHPEKEERIGCFFPWGAAGLMTLCGVTDGARSRVLIVDGGRFDMLLRLRTCWGSRRQYAVAPVFCIRDRVEDAPLHDEITIQLLELEGGYPAVARAYYEFMRVRHAIPTLSEKAAANPLLEYDSRAIAMRMRLACKELPTPILEQTPEHQPKLNCFMSFADVRTVLEECRRQEVGPLDCCLVGWNYGGHDGAFPQIFPVEERLGGETELRRTIQRCRELGYRIGLHDNYFDSYTIADSFRWEDVSRTAEQLPALSAVLAGGQSYVVCPRRSVENARRNMRETKQLGIDGIHFTDVLSVWPLEKCYSPAHPLSRRECALWRKKIFQLSHDTFGGSMSEGGQDWAFPELDRVYDLVDTPEMPAWCDEEIPLYPMVWHGSVLYNTYRGAINSWPGERIYLRNLAFGGLPTIYWHYIFSPSQTAAGGQDPKKDLKFDRKTLTEKVARIRRVTDDVRRLEPVRFARITGYREHSDTLTETIYSNGFRFLANYGGKETNFDGVRIGAGDFALVAGNGLPEEGVNPRAVCSAHQP